MPCPDLEGALVHGLSSANERIFAQFMVWLLDTELAKWPTDASRTVAMLYRRRVNGDEPNPAEWQAAMDLTRGSLPEPSSSVSMAAWAAATGAPGAIKFAGSAAWEAGLQNALRARPWRKLWIALVGRFYTDREMTREEANEWEVGCYCRMAAKLIELFVEAKAPVNDQTPLESAADPRCSG